MNLFNAIASIPANGVAGLNRFSAAMVASGSWWVYTPTNVLGWDPANPEMTKGLVDALLAIPSLSTPMGDAINWWLTANLPMHEGCTGLPPRAHPEQILNNMFRVPIWDFFDEDGYTFDPPITPTNNPVSQHEGEVGQELGETGDPVPWSGQTVKLDPFEGIKSFINYLSGPPSEIKTVSPQDAIESVTNLFAALTVTWNPFVPMSYIWNPQYQLLAPLFRAFAPILCPTCNPEDPFLPPDDITSIPEPDSARMVTLDASAFRCWVATLSRART